MLCFVFVPRSLFLIHHCLYGVLFVILVTDNELRRLYKRFKKLDVDSSGTITLSEFKSIPELSMK